MTTKRQPKKAEPTEAPFVPMTLEQAEERITALMKAELAMNWTEDKIKQRIHKSLNDAFNNILATALGFELDSWNGKWKVDHCNGRAGESTIGKMIAELAVGEVKTAIAEGIKEGKFTITKSHMEALQREFNENVNGYKAREMIQQVAQQRLSRLTKLLSGEITGAEA